MKNPKISVVIPAHNEEDTIKRAMQSIFDQTFQNFELIVVNDGSTDKTRKIVENSMNGHKNLQIINFKDGHSAAFARNRGAEKAKGELLMFLDADCWLDNNTMENIYKRKNDGDSFCFPCYPKYTTLVSKVLSAFVKPTFNDKSIEGVYNKHTPDNPMFFSMKKSVFDSIGGYEEKIFYYEDDELAKKFYSKGFSCVFFKGSNQYFELPLTFSEFFRQCKWIAKGTNTIQDGSMRLHLKTSWFLKFLSLILPLFFLFNLGLALNIFLLEILLVYLLLLKRNKRPFLTLLAIPFFYVKTLIVSFNLLKSPLKKH